MTLNGYQRPVTPRVTTLGVRGAVDDMVLQRRGDSGCLKLASSATAPVSVRAVDEGGAEHACVSLAPGSRAGLELAVGGPYRIEATAAGGATEVLAERVLVGDLWVLAGQSNMYGLAHLDGAEQPHPLVHMLDMARRWRIAEDPLHSGAHSPDLAHLEQFEPEMLQIERDYEHRQGAGLGLAFAREMVAATSVPVGLIPVARGGTNLAQWSPDLACMGGESLYGSMLLSVLAAGGRVRGVLWYQGESDSGTAESAELYRAAHRTLVEAIRRDLGAETRFLQVQLCRNVLIPVSVALPWSQVRVHQVDAETGADGWVASIDVEMVDPIHVGTEGLRRIGRRLARLAQGRAEPIRVAAVERSGTLGEWPAALRVRIAFSGLRGGLRPRLHLPGFSVRSPDGEEVSMIYRAEVLPDDRHAVVLSLSGVPRTPEDGIWYGFGANPYCDLVDEEDNAVPSFGPIPLVPPG